VAALRHLTTVTATLRPNTVSLRADSLTVFSEYLAGAHPDVRSLPQLTSEHIEGFLAHNHKRPWRGRRLTAFRLRRGLNDAGGRRAARPHVQLAVAPGSTAVWLAAQRELRRRSWPIPLAPAPADVLLAAGDAGREFGEALEAIPALRARVQLTWPEDAEQGLDTAQAALGDHAWQRAALLPGAEAEGGSPAAPGGRDESRDGGDEDGMEMPGGLPVPTVTDCAGPAARAAWPVSATLVGKGQPVLGLRLQRRRHPACRARLPADLGCGDGRSARCSSYPTACGCAASSPASARPHPT